MGQQQTHTPGPHQWVVVDSSRGRFMLIEETGTDDGRLVADGLTRGDADHIAWLHNESRAAIARATGADHA